MMTDPGQPNLGRPAEHHPSFLPPAAAAPGPAVPPPAPTWPAPPPPPPGGPPPPPARRPSVGPIVAAVVGALLLAGVGWYVWGLLGSGPVSPPGPAASPTAPATAARPTPAAPQPVTGGDVGREVGFTSDGGAGVVRVTSAAWAGSGEMAPGDGLSYLVVDLEFTATQGEVSVGSLQVDALDADGRAHLFAFGPELDEPLRSRLLPAGQAHSGQVGFELARGPVVLRILDASLRPVATIQVPPA